jgi:uncharacterized protein
MDNAKIIEKTEAFVRSKSEGEGSGHDWWHIYRVWNTALRIAKEENVDLFVVQLAALLHDIGDWKFHEGDDSVGPRMAREWLERLDVAEETISHVCEIISDMSFKGARPVSTMKSPEGMVVQDADRLDAIGAIGIGRAFAYGGFRGKEIYNPDIKPEYHESFEQYKNSVGPTINHFYEKLLLLKDRMNTTTGRQIAEERHAYMEEYLKRFFKELDGNA